MIRVCAAWLVVVLAFSAADPLPGAPPRFDDIEHLTIADGLSHSSVWAVHQDRRGFLWFATANGIDRYDGYEIRTFRHDPDDPGSPTVNEAKALYEDHDGTIWFSTRSRGLNRFVPSTERFERYEHDPEDPTTVSAQRIGAVHRDRSGVLWVGTEAGLDRFDDVTGTFSRVLHDPDDPTSRTDAPVWAIEEASDGALWMGMIGGGLDRYHPSDGTFEHFRHDPRDAESLIHDTVFDLLEDRDGHLWVGTADGLARYDRDREIFVHYRHDPDDPRTLHDDQIRELVETRDGELWIGTADGLHRVERDADDQVTFTRYLHDPDDPFSLSSSWINTLHEDRTGVLWIATASGVSKFDPVGEQFTRRRLSRRDGRGIGGSKVLAFAEDRDGLLWVGSDGGGLTALDRATDVATRHPTSSDVVTSILEDQAGELWVGTQGGGLDRFDRRRRLVSNYRHDPEQPSSLVDDSVTALLETRAGQLWVGTDFGLQRVDRDRRAFVRYLADPEQPRAQSIDEIHALFEDRAGDLWVATVGGLVRLPLGDDPESTAFEVFVHDSKDPTSLSNNEVTSIVEGNAGQLWVGTYGGGINRLPLDPLQRADGMFRSYRRQDGLASDGVVGLVVEDDGVLWISTNRGLSRFDPTTETFRHLCADDGLHSDVFHIGAALRSARGELFFGGDGGMTSFDPDRLVSDPHPPRVLLTDFRLLNQSVRLRDRDPTSPLTRSITETTELVLNHRHRTLGFTFAALHYASPDENRYRYQLEGFDDGWIDTDASRRTAQYTNLDADDYVFRVRAANPDGVWADEEVAVRITVRPAPWRTWWAYSLAASLVALAVAGYVRSQRETLRRERAVNTRLREVDRLKDEFLANTSHELRTPLHGITGLAESLLDGVHGELSDPVKANLGMVLASGHRLNRLVNDIVDFSKLRHESLVLDPHSLDLWSLVDVVLTLSRPLVGGKEVELVNAVPSDLPPVFADDDRLQQIVHNLVGNAIKFTEVGTVTVSAEHRPAQDGDDGGSRVVVRVADTGIGIAESEQTRIFAAFEQADASVARSYGGAGLGLAVTRRLVELHGGHIDVESRLGDGAIFYFDLPVAPAVADGTDIESSASRTPALPAFPGSAHGSDPGVVVEPDETASGPVSTPARVLVVDDEPINLQVLRNHLSRARFEVTTAASGAEALA
ncbi:MAG: two-component regulator propeller domain-containing protein, partial [Acidobacteriota bacterium]